MGAALFSTRWNVGMPGRSRTSCSANWRRNGCGGLFHTKEVGAGRAGRKVVADDPSERRGHFNSSNSHPAQRTLSRRRRLAPPVKSLRSPRVGSLVARPFTEPSGVGSLRRPKVPHPPASDRTLRQKSPIRRRRIADRAKIDQSAAVGSVNSPEDRDPTAS